ncbi:alpha/beta hydrolase family protein [Sediminitomix flava]|uniref:Pimeloyl-ACP methyl ester carboxylesterase n=1 Tax=Sediminitomix flava TaxID=379075 RepID=A0A315Z5D7_SEDFL|nr:alpha/beta hydrolase [Sediminitomix flava]PWJ39113.1 pimeloyl-ACP methyl ester carboxylesterase [Sediminitomix flava]
MHNQETHLRRDLFCHIYGKGEHHVWCFHGFGQDHRVFKNLAKKYPNKSFHCFDLAYHGGNLKPYSQEEWLQQILQYWVSLESPSLELIAFSIGARPCLKILSLRILNIQKVTLIAPDGIRNHVLFSFLAGNKSGKYLFDYFINSSLLQNLFQQTVKHLFFLDKNTRKLGLEIGSNINHLKKVQSTWLYYFDFRIDNISLSEYINSNGIEVQFILGKQDKIISKRSISPLFNLLNSKKIELFQCNHWNLLPFWIRKHNI